MFNCIYISKIINKWYFNLSFIVSLKNIEKACYKTIFVLFHSNKETKITHKIKLKKKTCILNKFQQLFHNSYRIIIIFLFKFYLNL